ncbi:MAG: hypothetical protein LBE34_13750 [Flavobacteriaceae bacterium]|jgi:ElaB/YqjD/DUF883 family membrane-anchored ribosome-binding protein|nr:hypothetical protein [Flavobacteriaceae bacterium]
MNIVRIFYFLISAAIGIVFYIQYQLFIRIDNINNSIENLKLKNDKKIVDVYKLIFESHFKNDLVLSSFNISTTIIITFFTIIIALGGYLSFNKINDEIKKLKKLKKEVKETKTKIEDISSEIIRNNDKLINDTIESKTNEIHHLIISAQVYYNLIPENKTYDPNIIINSLVKIVFNYSDLEYIIYNLNNKEKEDSYKEDCENLETNIIDVLLGTKNHLKQLQQSISQAELKILIDTLEMLIKTSNIVSSKITKELNSLINHIKELEKKLSSN